MLWVLKGVRFFVGLLLKLTPRDPAVGDWKLVEGEAEWPRLNYMRWPSPISCAAEAMTLVDRFSISPSLSVSTFPNNLADG